MKKTILDDIKRFAAEMKRKHGLYAIEVSTHTQDKNRVVNHDKVDISMDDVAMNVTHSRDNAVHTREELN